MDIQGRMSDPQEPAEVTGIGSPPDGMRAPQASDVQPKEAEQAMEIAVAEPMEVVTAAEQMQAVDQVESTTMVVEEALDSRTSMAGRNRNLQEPYHGDRADSDGESDERPRKRVKDHQDPPLVEEGLVNDTTSPPAGVSTPTQNEADVEHQQTASEPAVPILPQVELERSQALEAESHSLSSLANKGAEAQKLVPAPVTQPILPQTWNGGISSGLRTSFGSVPRTSFAPKSTPTLALGLQATVALADRAGASSVSSSALSTKVNSPNVASFKELSREEQDKLSGDDKALYLKSLFAQIRGSPPRNVAAPPVTGVMFHANSSASSSVSQGGGATTPAISRPGPIPYFRKLSKCEKKKLSPEARAAYVTAYEAWDRQKVEARRWKKAVARATKSVNEQSRHDEIDGTGEPDMPLPRPFRRLKKTRIDSLSQHELAEYNIPSAAHLLVVKEETRKAKEAKKATRQAMNATMQPAVKPASKPGKPTFRDIQQASSEVAAAIARSYPFLPGDSQMFIEMMESGKTLYPRKLSATPEYMNKSGTWKLFEMLSAESKPLQIHEISFNEFAPYFLGWYKNDWSFISQKVLTGAFSQYITAYYGHLVGFSSVIEERRATASASDAIAIHRAKKVAGQLLHHPGPGQTQQAAPSIKPQTQAKLAPVELSDSGLPRQDANNDSDITMVDAPVTLLSNTGDVAPTNAPYIDEEPMDMELHQAELYLQQRYYPSLDLNILRCIACSKTGHHILKCPLIACSICQTKGIHSEAMCPQKKRCDKCRDRGHNTKDCKEKLSLPKSEMYCDICHSSDHLELACHYVWRSFDPSLEDILTVQNILVDCYSCGSSGHFGPDCGLHRGVVYSGGLTWSQRNLEMYVNPSSQTLALSAAKDYSIPTRGPKKGNAADPITIDDESDPEPFIRPTVLPSRPQNKQIQVQSVQKQKQAPPKRLKKKKNKQPPPPPVPYRRNLNPPRASRPEFGSNYNFDNPTFPPNPPSGPRSGGHTNNFGNGNRGGGANRGGCGGFGGGRGGG